MSIFQFWIPIQWWFAKSSRLASKHLYFISVVLCSAVKATDVLRQYKAWTCSTRVPVCEAAFAKEAVRAKLLRCSLFVECYFRLLLVSTFSAPKRHTTLSWSKWIALVRLCIFRSAAWNFCDGIQHLYVLNNKVFIAENTDQWTGVGIYPNRDCSGNL